MAEFSISQAAFAGFQFIKQKPGTIAVWGGAYVLVMLVILLLFFIVAGASMLPLFANPAALENNPAAILTALPGLIGAGLLAFVVALAWGGVLYSAVLRAFLRPEEGGFGYFRFGRDELRLIGAYLLLLLLMFAAVFAVQMVIGVIVLALGRAGAAAMVLLVPVAIAAYIWVAVRLSLFLVVTFDRRRISIGEAWALTKGRFWPIFGTFLLVALLCFAGTLVLYLIIAAVGGVFAFSGAQGDAAALGAGLRLMSLINLLVYPFVFASFLAIGIGAAVHIYRAVGGTLEKAEAFA